MSRRPWAWPPDYRPGTFAKDNLTVEGKIVTLDWEETEVEIGGKDLVDMLWELFDENMTSLHGRKVRITLERVHEDDKDRSTEGDQKKAA